MTGVLVDTCVWSLALRGEARAESIITNQLTQLIDYNEARIIGPVRQELLSGYSDKNHYERLRQKLIYFPNDKILDVDYECAAEYSNICRVKGVQGSHTDFLICAVAARARHAIFTTDADFKLYARHLPIALCT